MPYPQTSCSSVVHIGDSTSVGLESADFLHNPAYRLTAQYKDVGVKNVTTDISGARAIIEHWNNQPNSLDAIKKFEAQGYQGCYVLAIGNNDVANISVGGAGPISARIDLMMQHAGSNPVMWLTSRTLKTSGPYTDANFPSLSNALIAACEKYPNLRVFDWRNEVQTAWYQPADKIHYTSHGYKERAERIARALANAFPASGATSSCVVHSGLSASQ
ncbi:SGNH/GDSL hydrolase family protein [Branchiibius sp. NY16-3462-2]|uniref:SGNH/GDSL hydrolase family protein n=1 Tax=Branchiibius sp. NY16-3462-2 TaxID=1807500 RepID=UPI0025BF2766|nr:SGNH/GDSL hydrolase family protein [Branchiibius sp. NY16-3462-2]